MAGVEDSGGTVPVLADPRRFGLTRVALPALDPFLRGLLVNDGLVTRALEDRASAEVRVSVVDQGRAPVPAALRPLLEVGRRCDAVRRQVTIGPKHCPGPSILAESFIVPDRLPPHFLASLARNEEGIGATLQELQLPTRREVVCYGLSAAVPWADESAVGQVLVRLYRIVADAGPAIFISEAFVLESAPGLLRLANTYVPSALSASGGRRV